MLSLLPLRFMALTLPSPWCVPCATYHLPILTICFVMLHPGCR